MSKYFHFTLGPVQGFVSQARRSRDYWAGSFLLSWLAGVAISSVRAQQGNISFPIPDDDFIHAIENGVNGVGPKQGGIPNRFKTGDLAALVNEDFNPNIVCDDIKDAWQALCNIVWDCDLEPFFEKEKFDKEASFVIWQRQVSNFWEMNWVLTEDSNVTNLLDRRKNWRTQLPKEEPGTKCMMMEGYQELSGSMTPNKSHSQNFWQALQKHLSSGQVDLNSGEQLCALAFIKRRFSRHFWKLSEETQNKIRINGWSFGAKQEGENSPVHVPSLPYLAAVPWLANIIEKTKDNLDIEQAFDSFCQASQNAFGQPSKSVHFNCLTQLADNQECLNLDGISYFPNISTSDQNYKQASIEQKQLIEKSAKQFEKLRKVSNIQPPSPFYALLIMDGDSLGAQMGDPDKQAGISEALNTFTNKVPNIVSLHNGFLNYAGGDDVLAMLPMEYAIKCASALKTAYDECFKDKKAFSTLSGAIQFAHIKTPLMKIIKASHNLLDDVAKAQSGRNSLAIRINKPGGIHAEWVMPWEKFDESVLTKLTTNLASEESSTITNGWLNRTLQLINTLEQSLPFEDLNQLICQEYKHAGGGQSLDPETVELLISLCRRFQRNIDDQHNVVITQEAGYQGDAIKLVRFMANKGADKI